MASAMYLALWTILLCLGPFGALAPIAATPVPSKDLDKPSRMWAQLGREHTRRLESGKGYKNFRTTIAKRYITDGMFSQVDLANAYRLANQEGLDFRGINDSLVGKPLHLIDAEGRIITQDLIISLQEHTMMAKTINFTAVQRMAEIGGGYGRMGSLVLQRYPHIEYNIIDIPPAATLSRWYLKLRFLNAKINWHLPSEATTLKDVDAFYSSSVLTELKAPQVAAYFSLINKCGRFFYLKDFIRAYDSRIDEASYPVRPHWKVHNRHQPDVQIMYGKAMRRIYKGKPLQMFEILWENTRPGMMDFLEVKKGTASGRSYIASKV